MYNAKKPSDTELPSTVRLLKSTIVAAVAALVLLVTLVMPAEYGIDPTGIGGITGLTRMGEIKMALAAEAEAEEQALAAALDGSATPAVVAPVTTQAVAPTPEPATVTAEPIAAAPVTETTNAVQPGTPDVAAAAPAATDTASAMRSDEMQVSLAPGEGTEIKVTLARGKTVEYSWQSVGGIANFDVHGDSALLDIDYHNYSRGAEQSSSGVLEAAFDGNHGWFWRNRTANPITVTLQTRGEYTDIKHLE